MADQPPTPAREDWITKLAQLSIIGLLFGFFLWLLDDWVDRHFDLMKMVVERVQ